MVWALASLVSQHNTILKVRRKDTDELVDIDLVSRAGNMIAILWVLLREGASCTHGGCSMVIVILIHTRNARH